ncbi:MAG: hypothetical protein V4857_14410 [Pseudomonadota bacterium]
MSKEQIQAAAPDLLAALETFVKLTHDDTIMALNDGRPKLIACLSAANAAIDKAKAKHGIAEVAGKALAGMGSSGLSEAVDYIEKRAQEYLDESASTEHDTGAINWHYGEAGRDYYNTLTELAEELRGLTPLPAAPSATPTAQAQASVVCSTCRGTGIVDDGEIVCYPNGEPYMCGPVKCVKDCPSCGNPARPVQSGYQVFSQDMGDWRNVHKEQYDRANPAFRQIVSTPTARNPAAADWAAPGGADAMEVLRNICDMQVVNYGDGMKTHLALIDLARRGRVALAAPERAAQPVAAPAGAHVGAQDKIDAERYRWVRARLDDDVDYKLMEFKKGCDYGFKQGSSLDAAIDAAIARATGATS